MNLNLRSRQHSPKQKLKKHCRICLQNRGVIKHISVCRKCFYQNVDSTDYKT